MLSACIVRLASIRSIPKTKTGRSGWGFLQDLSCSSVAGEPARTDFVPGVAVGVLVGSCTTACIWFVTRDVFKPMNGEESLAAAVARSAREELPSRIILVRHGETEANADFSVYRRKPDNLHVLTEQGRAEAVKIGSRIKQIIGNSSVCCYISPSERALQTSRLLQAHFKDQVVFGTIDPRIREQEFGNIVGEHIHEQYRERSAVGRFYYRFSDGESGADVYDRLAAFWNDLLQVNLRPKSSENCVDDTEVQHVDTVIIVTHGLTMRLFLMQLFKWSPNTFHTVHNPSNGTLWVLTKNLSKSGFAPYVLDCIDGDMPHSSIDLEVEFRKGDVKTFKLNNYLSLPQPRARQFEKACAMLVEQHGIDRDAVARVNFFKNHEQRLQYDFKSSGG